MSIQNQISIAIPPADVIAVTEKLQEVKTILAPYLQGLTAKERQELFKMGNKTVANVKKTSEYVISNPEFVPAYMNTVEFTKDETVVTQLGPIANLADQIATDVSDTVMLCGSEALKQAMYYYGTVKEAHAKGVVSARPIYEDLSARFTRRGHKKAPPASE